MKLETDRIYIPSTKQTRETLKMLGGVWSAKQQGFAFPKSVHALDEIAHFLPDLAKTTAFQQIIDQLTSARNVLKQKKQQQPQPHSALRPYQAQDVHYLTQIPNAAIFNQARTGKTPTTIETIKARQTKRNVIICPASLQINWKKEIEAWHPEATVYLYIGTPKARKSVLEAFFKEQGVSYLITSKDTAKRNVDDLTAHPLDVLVVDEAHFLRNRDTAQSEAIYTIGKQAKHRYALTGTPTVKHPADIYGILHFLYPKKWSSYWQFVDRYFKIYKNAFGTEIGEPKKHREAELKDFIDAISTQRLRKDVMQWLPDKQYHTHTVTISDKQRKAYKSMANDFIAERLDGTELDAQTVLTQLLRLRQIVADPKLLNIDAPSAKTDALLDIIENNTYTDAGEPLVVMSIFTSYLNYLKPQIEAMGKRVGMICGDMSAQEKDDTARAFQRGEIDVLLCNIVSAGTGFTLDKGEVIIFLDKAWNPADNEQAEDRITPTQQNKVHKHFIVSLVCEESIDEYIEKTLKRKDSLTSIINRCKSIDAFRMFFV